MPFRGRWKGETNLSASPDLFLLNLLESSCGLALHNLANGHRLQTLLTDFDAAFRANTVGPFAEPRQRFIDGLALRFRISISEMPSSRSRSMRA